MNDNGQQLDDHMDLRVTPKFSEDLGKLFASDQPIPACVDRAVAEAARRHFVRPRPRLWKLRWAMPATAAAAILLGVCIWWLNIGPAGQSVHEAHPQALAASQAQADVDQNGKVDILDAFALARHLESSQPADQAWDFNGDGLIDRRDVDMVALAAVRLNKGV